MPTFKYIAKKQDGQALSGAIDVPNRESAVDYLRKQNLVIISVEETKGKPKTAFFSGARRVGLDDIVVLSRQLATMVDAGIPLVSAFDILAEQAEKAVLREILIKIRDDIQTGNSFSGAISKHPKVFSPLFVNMVKAGETSGMLDEILERVATYLEKTNALIRKVKAALVYPAIITLMAIVITTILLVKVVPVFQEIFAGFGADLPTPTLILINVSSFLRRNLAIGCGIIVVGGFALARYVKTDRGKTIFDTFLLRMPIFGKLVNKVAVSKFTRTLSTLTKSGVPILTSLEIVAKTAGNKVIEKAVEQVHKNIKEGERIAEPLARSNVFPPMVVRMIAVGEETGEMEKMLTKVSDFYDEQVEAAISGLTSLIEPLIIAFLGIVIGSIVISMFMPIFKLTTIIQI